VLLRDLLFKDRHYFRDFLVEEMPATNILSDRLKNLEAAGVLRRRRDHRRGNQVHYSLTPKGVALVPVFLAMIDWSARHDEKTEAPAEFLAAYRADPVAFAEKLAFELAHAQLQQ
jgi:DNA-binding HxlR family transcriptional regulator